MASPHHTHTTEFAAGFRGGASEQREEDWRVNGGSNYVLRVVDCALCVRPKGKVSFSGTVAGRERRHMLRIEPRTWTHAGNVQNTLEMEGFGRWRGTK